MQEIPFDLLTKYNVAIPRYTSYPTVPFWEENIDAEHWKLLFIRRFNESNTQEGISLYIHLPYCESLCTFCGCNKRITTNHSVEKEYIDTLIKEWNLYKILMGKNPVIREFHIGGGTPTFFSPENLTRLLQAILKDSIVPEEHEFGFEGHPNNTTKAHLKMFRSFGFNRVSFGMQDSNLEVQQIINRIQPLKNVKRVVKWARELGYESINLDLVYGLPRQDLQKITKTIEDALTIRPDRIAFYSYAHVPWTSRAQRLFDERDLPQANQKMALYQQGKNMFSKAGYVDIGMDHFALPADQMVLAHSEGNLHRNFMGYTVQKTGLLLGLGVSSISDIYYGFAQNKKSISEYFEQINREELAVFKGYFLNYIDQKMRQYILDIACQGRTFFREDDLALLEEFTFEALEALAGDGLLNYGPFGVELTDLGKHFTRNVCKAFDLKLHCSQVAEKSYSQAI